jgi:hypothetical protein
MEKRHLSLVMRKILDRYSKKTFLHLFLVLMLCFLSVKSREDFVKREFTDKGWVSAHTLITIDIWEREGASKFGYCPVYIYENPGDNSVSMLGGVSDKDNRYYYVSYPPMTFIAPYLFFKLTGIDADEVGLRYFNILLHCISAWLVYLILLHLFGKSLKSDLSWQAIVGVALYLFSSGTLLFHTEIFFADILVQPFFLAQILFYLRWKHNRQTGTFVWMLVFSALAIYTEWLGLFVLFTIFILIAFDFDRSFKQRLPFLASIGVLTLLVLGAIIMQYSSIAGWDALFEASKKKYMMRSGHSGVEGSEYGFSMGNPESWKFLEGHFNKWYLPMINLLGFVSALFVVFSLLLKEARPRLSGFSTVFLLLFPLLLHLLVFFNFNVVHDMGTLKIMTVVFILIAVMVFKMDRAIPFQWGKFAFAGIVLVFVSVKSYQSVERYRLEMPQHFHGDFQKRIGKEIQEFAKPEDIVFTNAFVVPELIFYSKRNMFGIADSTEQRAKMLEWGVNASVFFRVDGVSPVEKIRMEKSGDSLLVTTEPFKN